MNTQAFLRRSDATHPNTTKSSVVQAKHSEETSLVEQPLSDYSGLSDKISPVVFKRSNLEWVYCQSQKHKLHVVMRAHFMGFYSNVGSYYPLLEALKSRDLPPPALIGVSCGSVAAWLIGSGLDQTTVLSMLYSLQRSDIFEHSSVIGCLMNYLRDGYFSSGVNTRKKLQEFVKGGAKARLEACKQPVSVVVTTMDNPVQSHWQQLVTNIIQLFNILICGEQIVSDEPHCKPHAITRGDAAEAVMLSASMPLLYPPNYPPEQIRTTGDMPHCLDGGWGDGLGVTAWPQDPDAAVLLTHVDVEPNMWDKKPLSLILNVPQKPIPQRDHINLFRMRNIPKFDEIKDVLLRGDLSARQEVVRKSNEQMREWLQSDYQELTADDMNKICLTELNYDRYSKKLDRKNK